MRLKRKNRGALLAEFTANIYLIFVFLVFPLLDLSVLGFRAFFLWFAANQAVSAACKAKTYLQPIGDANKVTYPSACDLASSKAHQIKMILPGIHWDENDNNPDVQILRQPINPHAKNAQPAQ